MAETLRPSVSIAFHLQQFPSPPTGSPTSRSRVTGACRILRIYCLTAETGVHSVIMENPTPSLTTVPFHGPIPIASLCLAITAVCILCWLIIRQLMRKSIPNSNQHMDASDPQTTVERAVSESQLSKSNGEQGQPIFIAVKDPFSTKITVFDVTSAKEYYGPGGPYHVFAAKNATLGLATSSLDPDTVTGDLCNLTESQKDTHMQWHAKYSTKYPIVGYLVPDGSAADQETESVSAQDAQAKKNA